MKLEVFLSTDGKHTVRAEVLGTESLSAAYKVYDQIVEKYGASNKRMTNGTLGKCPDCGAPQKMSKRGKPYCSAKCWL